ncbi:hypothetical protein [Streptomyces sp. NRRL S-646]|uniref:hypothetical protein n=1 Tax=Streptomyces sp. NRRL S-646 TaxID=1463917 RepID=UPI0013317291|nr:hypothetical protein [Streptomyces sp. NRRL S-646]
MINRKGAVLDADGALFLKGKGILAALSELFDSVWQRAVPLGDVRDETDEHRPSAVETEYLRILSDGHTDEVIARLLGVSPVPPAEWPLRSWAMRSSVPEAGSRLA